VTDFQEIFDRIKLATNTKTQLEVAEVLGIRQSSISDAKKRNSVPSDWCVKLFVRFGISPDWLIQGSGPMLLRTDAGYTLTDPNLPSAPRERGTLHGDPNAKSCLVSVRSMLEWPGEDGVVTGKLAIPQSFYTSSLVVFRLDGTDMEPLIRKGAFLGVDTAQKRVVSGELYALGMCYGNVAVRRLFLGNDGRDAVLRAENPHHPETPMNMEALANAVIGRVVWTLNMY
jgi:Predicted transcriptional regulator